VNGQAVFVATTDAAGAELWVSDGTALGTKLVADANPGSDGSSPTIVGPLAENGLADPSRLLVQLDDGTNGQELWATNGTGAGTLPYATLNAGAAGAFALPGLEVATKLADFSNATGGVTYAIDASTVENILGSSKDDTFTGSTAANAIDGGAGTDTVVFSQKADQYTIGILGNVTRVSGPDGADEMRFVEQLQFGATAAITVDSLRGQPGTEELYQNLVDGQLRFGLPTRLAPNSNNLVYILPADNGSDVLEGTSFNDFANLGAGNDAAAMGAGDDFVDGGGGSNFLTGGLGSDTFFIDGRDLVPVWSCITDWQPGEKLTLWGWRDGVSLAAWDENNGLPGFLGATLFADIDGNGLVETAITWTGVTKDQLPTPVPFEVSGVGVYFFN
jgi:ELWxxDGT repeat protein